MVTKNPRDFIERFLKTDHFGRLIGVKILSLTDEECVSEYAVNPIHFNPNGILHGGVLFSVMDSSQGMLLHYLLGTGENAATGTATIKYLAPLKGGNVTVKTKLSAREGRKIFMNSQAFNDTGILVADLNEIWIQLAQPHC